MYSADDVFNKSVRDSAHTQPQGCYRKSTKFNACDPCRHDNIHKIHTTEYARGIGLAILQFVP